MSRARVFATACRAATLCAAVVSLFSLTPRRAVAYVFSGPKWADASFPITYSINPAGVPASIGEASMIAAAQAGFASWEAPACTYARATYSGTTTLTKDPTDYVSVMQFLRTAWPPEYGSTVLGVTSPVFSMRTGALREADTIFNAVDHTWDLGGVGGNIDFESIATHEQGHALGLDHSADATAIMAASYPGGLHRALNADDRAGICALYPAVAGPDAGVEADASVVIPDSGTSGVDAGTSTIDAGMGGEDSGLLVDAGRTPRMMRAEAGCACTTTGTRAPVGTYGALAGVALAWMFFGARRRSRRRAAQSSSSAPPRS